MFRDKALKYKRNKLLGEGTYGTVYEGEDRSSGKIVALKQVTFNDAGEGVPSTTLREVAILKSLVHPNIVRLEDVVQLANKVYLVFELLESDLKVYIDSMKGHQITSSMLRLTQSYVYQLLLAINFCHSHRFLHRDIKPANILIDGRGNLKLADFGLGRAHSMPVSSYTHEVVTLYYRAPEILLGSPVYSTPVDVWSVGCIFAELVTGDPLFKAASEIDLLFRMYRTLGTPDETIWPGVSKFPEYKPEHPCWRAQDLKAFVGNLPSTGAHLLARLLVYNPSRRITASEALKHPYFTAAGSGAKPRNTSRVDSATNPA